MTTVKFPSQPPFLKRKLLFGATVSTIILIVIMLISLGLHLYNIQSIGDANAYYTAAVRSMLMSWKNFFFVAAEPGGSVTVDKPPLGLWIEAVFAYFLGVSGFSVSLPNILAGILGIPLLYVMVTRTMDELAGLIAALVMTVTPVFVATNRNNTMDGLLVFFLLMAAWAFIQASESGRLRWLLLGAFLVGLGFNIKMMQAFLPLPAFYALYFFGSREGWIRKSVNLGIATILLVIVSLSWAVVVDLTPTAARPRIGSSRNNTVLGLIFEHNGISRLESTGGPAGNGPQGGVGTRQEPPKQAVNACENLMQGDACSFTLQNGSAINGSCITPPNMDILACAPQGMTPQQNGQSPLMQGRAPNGGPAGQGGGTQFSQETGEPGLLRFFTAPLSKQMSWLLPFALISVLLALRIKPSIDPGVHKGLILWGGWLLICLVFFSMISGIFHSYYAIMPAPALGAMTGIGFAQLWSWGRDGKRAGILLIAASAVTLGYQTFALGQYGVSLWWMLPAGILLLLGIMLMGVSRRAAYLTLLSALLVIPVYWTVMSVVSVPDNNLPTAYAGVEQGRDGRGASPRAGTIENTKLLSYLEANTQDVEYLVAVPASQNGTSFVLSTGRPVLYMGGFNGADDVVSAEDLAQMVADGELRYVMYGSGRGAKADIATWLSASCSAVTEFSGMASGDPGPGSQANNLYVCR